MRGRRLFRGRRTYLLARPSPLSATVSSGASCRLTLYCFWRDGTDSHQNRTTPTPRSRPVPSSARRENPRLVDRVASSSDKSLRPGLRTRVRELVATLMAGMLRWQSQTHVESGSLYVFLFHSFTMLRQAGKPDVRAERGGVMRKIPQRLHVDRVARRHRHHRRFDRAVIAGRAVGPRGRPPGSVPEQPEADRHRHRQLRERDSSSIPPARGWSIRRRRGCPGRGGLRPLVGSQPVADVHRAGEPVQQHQFQPAARDARHGRGRAVHAAVPGPQPREHDGLFDAGRDVPLPVGRTTDLDAGREGTTTSPISRPGRAT